MFFCRISCIANVKYNRIERFNTISARHRVRQWYGQLLVVAHISCGLWAVWPRNTALSVYVCFWCEIMQFACDHLPKIMSKMEHGARSDFIKQKMWKSLFLRRVPSSGMWRRVDLVRTDVSEEHVAPIFRLEKSASEEPASAGGCRLSHQPKTPSYIRTRGGGRESGPHW
jgi:hypothetical protein